MMTRALALLVLVVSCATPPPPPPPPKRDLREEVRRHGEWILVSPYGKLWHPNTTEVGKDFQPYLSGGSWRRAPEGWVFDARWEWSDVVFRHGRWMWTNDYDWLWWHEDVEGPARVDWRTGSEWVGWSPQPPPPPRANLPPAERRWFYVKARNFMQDEVGKYVVGGEDATRASELTEPAPNGPTLDFLVKNGGLVEEGDGGYRVPELAAPAPVAEPAPAPEPPKSNVEVELAKPPEKPAKTKEPKKTKKGKKK